MGWMRWEGRAGEGHARHHQNHCTYYINCSIKDVMEEDMVVVDVRREPLGIYLLCSDCFCLVYSWEKSSSGSLDILDTTRITAGGEGA